MELSVGVAYVPLLGTSCFSAIIARVMRNLLFEMPSLDDRRARVDRGGHGRRRLRNAVATAHQHVGHVMKMKQRESRVCPLRSGTSMAGARISAPATGALVFHLLLTSDGSAAVDQLGEQGLVENNQFLPDRVLPPSWH